MVQFWIGVSGFSYPSWIGTFYPPGTKSDRMLEAYASKLNSVEINSSFYNMPTQKATAKWAHLTPQNFRFCFKANRKITHFMKLKEAADETQFFIKGLNPLRDKLGCVLFQLPPFMKQDLAVLENFLDKKPKQVRVTLEFRHKSWFTPDLTKLLSQHNAALCIADTEEMKPIFERTGDFGYVRLRQDRYSDGDLKTWSRKLLEFTKGLDDCFVYFKHDETGEAANMAAEFRTLLPNPA